MKHGVLVVFMAVMLHEPAAASAPPPSSDNSDSISFQLALQYLWDYGLVEGAGDATDTTSNRLLFRRLRPVIKGKMLAEKFSYLLHLNLLPGSLELMDLWVDYRFFDWANVRMGQMKIPFTRYRLGSFKDLPVVDWSKPTHYFGAERQQGLMLHNGIGRPPVWEYQLGLFTGVNARASNGMGMAKVYGESVRSPSLLNDPDPALWAQMHSEIVAHLAWNPGGIDVRKPADFEGGDLRAAFGLSAAWDLDPHPQRDMRLRVAPEAEIKFHGFTAIAVAYLGFVDTLTSGEDLVLGLAGTVLQVSYLYQQRYQWGLRYTQVATLAKLLDDAREYALLRGDLSSLDPDNLLQAEHELNLGFTWFLYGTTIRWQNDVGCRWHQFQQQTRRDYLLRSQLQLVF